jgi:type IV pilus assembly protein PilP
MKNNLKPNHEGFKKTILLGLVCITLSACGGGDLADLEEKIAEIKARPKGKIPDLPTPKTTEPFSFDLDGSRDPFKPVEKQPDPTQQVTPGSLIKPDPNRIKEDLEQFPLDTLKMVGTLKKDSTLWALVESNNGTVYRITAGNYMGEHDGKIIEISNNAIQLMQILPDKEPNTWREEATTLPLKEQTK